MPKSSAVVALRAFVLPVHEIPYENIKLLQDAMVTLWQASCILEVQKHDKPNAVDLDMHKNRQEKLGTTSRTLSSHSSYRGGNTTSKQKNQKKPLTKPAMPGASTAIA